MKMSVYPWLYNSKYPEAERRGSEKNWEFLVSLEICLSVLSHTELLLVVTANISLGSRPLTTYGQKKTTAAMKEQPKVHFVFKYSVPIIIT